MKKIFIVFGFVLFCSSCSTLQSSKRNVAQVADGDIKSTAEMASILKLADGKPVSYNGWAGFSDAGGFCLNVVFIADPKTGIVRYYSKEWPKPSAGCDYEADQPLGVTPAYCVEDPIQEQPVMKVDLVPALDPKSPKYLQGMRFIDVDNESISGEGCAKSGPIKWPINSAIVRDSAHMPGAKEMVLNVGSNVLFAVFLQ